MVTLALISAMARAGAPARVSSHAELEALESKVKSMWSGLDGDGDGKITGRELLGALDADNDGTVSPFAAVVCVCGGPDARARAGRGAGLGV